MRGDARCQEIPDDNIPSEKYLYIGIPRYYVTSTTVTVTVTEALLLRPLLEDRGRITELIRILVPVDRMKQKCFQITTKQVRRSQQFQLRQ